MKNSKKILGGTFAALAIMVITAPAVFAYQGDPNIQGPNYSPERHTAMIVAFEGEDYDAWKELMADRGRVKDVITADNFGQFAEAHRLAHSGDLEGAKKIRAELGLGMKDGRGRGQGLGEDKGQGLKDGSGQGGGFGKMHR